MPSFLRCGAPERATRTPSAARQVRPWYWRPFPSSLTYTHTMLSVHVYLSTPHYVHWRCGTKMAPCIGAVVVDDLRLQLTQPQPKPSNFTDEPVTFSRAIDLGLTKRREGIGGTNENYTRLPPVKTPVKAKDLSSPGGNLSAQQGGAQDMAGEVQRTSVAVVVVAHAQRRVPFSSTWHHRFCSVGSACSATCPDLSAHTCLQQQDSRSWLASGIRYDAKGYPTKVDFSPPPSAVYTRVRRSLYS